MEDVEIELEKTKQNKSRSINGIRREYPEE